MNYTVGITTFAARFERSFVPLLESIRRDRPDVEVVVAANGDCRRSFDEGYRARFLQVCARHGGVYPVVFPEFRGLATLWNTLLRHASGAYVLLLNDDVAVESCFWPCFEHWVRKMKCSFAINGSWSHILWNREVVDALGWFDETFLGIGYEDMDMLWRFEDRYRRGFQNVGGVPGIRRTNPVDEDRSGVGRQNGSTGYSAFNAERLGAKYAPVDPSRPLCSYKPRRNARPVRRTPSQFPFERFYWEHDGEV